MDEAEKLGVKVYRFGGFHVDPELPVINLPGVKEDYESAFWMQFHGMKYVLDRQPSDFYYVIGTDAFPAVGRLLKFLESFDAKDYWYIGGHGWTRNFETPLYFHSGGAGFIISHPVIVTLDHHRIFEEAVLRPHWAQLVDRYRCVTFVACDVAMAYYIRLVAPYTKTVKDNRFMACSCCRGAGNFLTASLKDDRCWMKDSDVDQQRKGEKSGVDVIPIRWT